MSAHILIVDDDTRVTNALRRTLAYEGYSVSVAANGEGALAVARNKPPDLVILDLMLPGIDGLEVCRRLRAAGDGIAVLNAPMSRVEEIEDILHAELVQLGSKRLGAEIEEELIAFPGVDVDAAHGAESVGMA